MSATSSAWPYRNDIVLKINPQKRWKAFMWLVIVVTFFMMVIDNGSPVNLYLKEQSQHEQNDKLKPNMQRLADAGKQDAILWMANSYPGSENKELQVLSGQGNGQAMMLLAVEKWKGGQHDEAMHLVERAAEAGYAPAIQNQLVHKQS